MLTKVFIVKHIALMVLIKVLFQHLFFHNVICDDSRRINILRPDDVNIRSHCVQHCFR